MFVDVTSLIRDKNVKRQVKVYLKKPQATNEFGVKLPPTFNNDVEPDLIINNCCIVEQRDRILSPERGTYIFRISYDFYFPRNKVRGHDLTGATIILDNGRKFTLTVLSIDGEYSSHAVYNGTEVLVEYEGDARL